MVTGEGDCLIVGMEQSFYVFSHCPSGIQWQAVANEGKIEVIFNACFSLTKIHILRKIVIIQTPSVSSMTILKHCRAYVCLLKTV